MVYAPIACFYSFHIYCMEIGNRTVSWHRSVRGFDTLTFHQLSDTGGHQTTFYFELSQKRELLQPHTPLNLVLWTQGIILLFAGLAPFLKYHFGTKNKGEHQSQRVVNGANYTQKPSPGKGSAMSWFEHQIDRSQYSSASPRASRQVGNCGQDRGSWPPFLFLLQESPPVLCGHY